MGECGAAIWVADVRASAFDARTEQKPRRSPARAQIDRGDQEGDQAQQNDGQPWPSLPHAAPEPSWLGRLTATGARYAVAAERATVAAKSQGSGIGSGNNPIPRYQPAG
jgi:hypothetical protein